MIFKALNVLYPPPLSGYARFVLLLLMRAACFDQQNLSGRERTGVNYLLLVYAVIPGYGPAVQGQQREEDADDQPPEALEVQELEELDDQTAGRLARDLDAVVEARVRPGPGQVDLLSDHRAPAPPGPRVADHQGVDKELELFLDSPHACGEARVPSLHPQTEPRGGGTPVPGQDPEAVLGG